MVDVQGIQPYLLYGIQQLLFTMAIVGVMAGDWDQGWEGGKSKASMTSHEIIPIVLGTFVAHVWKWGEALCQIKGSSVQSEVATVIENSYFVHNISHNSDILNGKQIPMDYLTSLDKRYMIRDA